MEYIVVFGFLLLLFAGVWWWAGWALPPTSVIDRAALKAQGEASGKSDVATGEECEAEGEGQSSRQGPSKSTNDLPQTAPSLSEDSQPHPESPLSHGAQKIGEVTFASDFMYANGPPPLNTVSVRAAVLEIAIAVFCVLLWFHPGADPFGWLTERVAATPILWGTLAAVALVTALLLGAIRHTWIALLSRAAAIPALDDRGRPIFAYVGDVPPDRWQHSPWYRAISWVVVSVTSVFAALVGAILQEEWFATDMFAKTFMSVLIIRWLISAVSRLLIMFSTRGN